MTGKKQSTFAEFLWCSVLVFSRGSEKSEERPYHASSARGNTGNNVWAFTLYKP